MYVLCVETKIYKNDNNCFIKALKKKKNINYQRKTDKTNK